MTTTVSSIPSPVVIFFWIVLGMLSVVALLGNGFITMAIGHQWLQKGKMAPCDFPLAGLSTSRFLLQVASVLTYPVFFNIPHNNVYFSILVVMSVSWFFLFTANLWSATWLSVLYCVKVANFPNRLFLWLKTRIDALAPRLFAMSVVVSITFNLRSLIYYFQNRAPHNLTEIQSVKQYQDLLYLAPISLQFSNLALNFSLNITASILLLSSLWRHTRNLKMSGIAVKDLSTQVHIKVIKSVLLYLFLYVLHIAGMIPAASNIVGFGRPERLISEVFLSLLYSAHSAILIFTNPKLKKAFSHFLNIREWIF